MKSKAKYIKLGWEILEAKYRYYILGSPTLQDYEYDIMEKEYEKLADELGLPKSASEMVDFKLDRPSCQAVIEKIRTDGLYK